MQSILQDNCFIARSRSKNSTIINHTSRNNVKRNRPIHLTNSLNYLGSSLSRILLVNFIRDYERKRTEKERESSLASIRVKEKGRGKKSTSKKKEKKKKRRIRMQNRIEKWRYNNTSCMGANCWANPDRYTAHNKRTLTISIILTTVFEHGMYKYFSSCQYFCEMHKFIYRISYK